MNYHQGDRELFNEFFMEIYLNPKHYLVVDFEELLPFTEEKLEHSYNVRGIKVYQEQFIFVLILINFIIVNMII